MKDTEDKVVMEDEDDVYYCDICKEKIIASEKDGYRIESNGKILCRKCA